MLHSTLSKILVSVASRYAELSPSDVGIGIGGGRLVIENVKLRAETFNSPALPFHVHQGRAGRLRVNVPWSALSSAPVEVYLENVHLIAAPKQPSTSPPPCTSPIASPRVPPDSRNDAGEPRGEWHQTMVGRLAFNVSVEMYGLKVEYRDDACVGIISVASLRAFSAGRDWQSRFVSLAPDPDTDRADDTTALAMRKLVNLAGVHWVMIPRRSNAGMHATDYSADPQLDLESFESRSAIVDGIGITVRVLLCTGTARTQAHPDRAISGLHTELEVDLEEPNVNLTARQMKWVDHIFKQGFGLSAKAEAVAATAATGLQEIHTSATKRRPRYVTPADVHAHSEYSTGINQMEYESPVADTTYESEGSKVPPPPSDTDSLYSSQNPKVNRKADQTNSFIGEEVGPEIEEVSDYEDDESVDNDTYEEKQEYVKPAKGGLFSIWRAIVSENSDETVDDAAIALGLRDGYESSEENEGSFGESEENEADYLYARSAVAAAAEAGGLTIKLRIKTPDVTAWDLVESLREELEREKEVRQRLENLEAVLEEAEQRVRESEQEAADLRERNRSLAQEMEDFERLTSQAGKNKDAMIRQIEAAHSKAERNLQAMYQAQYEGPQGGSKAVVNGRALSARGTTLGAGSDGDSGTKSELETENISNRVCSDSESFSTDDSIENQLGGSGSERDTQNRESVFSKTEDGDTAQLQPPEAISMTGDTGEKSRISGHEVGQGSVDLLVSEQAVSENGKFRSEEKETRSTAANRTDMSEVELGRVGILNDFAGSANSKGLEEAMTYEGLTLI